MMRMYRGDLSIVAGQCWTVALVLIAVGCQREAPPTPRSSEAKSQVAPNDGKSAAKPKPQGDLAYHGPVDDAGNPLPPRYNGDWNQRGGSPLRNAVIADIPAELIPIDFHPGEFDRKTGEWKKETSRNIRYVANIGIRMHCDPVVASGKVFVGANNFGGYLKRYPRDLDLGCLLAFDEETGAFLWQDSNEKLPTGRLHDWPLHGVCGSPVVDGDRCWYVSNRGEVKCVDVDGFYDGTDDGEVRNALGRLFDIVRSEPRSFDDPKPFYEFARIVAELDQGVFPIELMPRLEKAGFAIEGESTVEVQEPCELWLAKVKHAGVDRELRIVLDDARLRVFKTITPDDKEEADVLWSVDMMKQFGTLQHNKSNCSMTTWGDYLLVNTSNGIHEDHKTIPAPDAPSFLCLNKNTGEVFWTDNSPGRNILHGQWSSPTVAVIDGVVQVIFAGGDAWVYSFELGKEKKLLWKFDANPKGAVLEMGGRGNRNDIIGLPIVYEGLVYFATGQDPEHGEGDGTLWCIDPRGRGDISDELVVKRDDPTKPLPHRRIQAINEPDGEIAVPNANSGVVWKLEAQDVDGDGELHIFEERFHRCMTTPVAHNGLILIADFVGIVWCANAKTGKVHWTHDLQAASWAGALVLGDIVYVCDEDGDVNIFKFSRTKELLAEIIFPNSIYTNPTFANGRLYIATNDHLFAIEAGATRD